AVVVGVDVDDTGRDEQAVGVDRLLRRGTAEVADLGDAAVVDGDVGGPGRGTGAVDDGAGADDEIVHASDPLMDAMCATRVALCDYVCFAIASRAGPQPRPPPKRGAPAPRPPCRT